MNILRKFVCPNCKNKLSVSRNTISCEKCLSKWPIVNNVPYFIDGDFYWGEKGISRDEMISLNEMVESDYWKNALQKHYSSKIKDSYYFYTNLKRARWHELLSLGKESIVLDIGAGMGTISDALSRVYKFVISLEPVIERINFMTKRFRQDDLKNIQIVRSDVSTLPFPKNFFDLVVLNGVLEWIPLRKPKENPRKTQLESLKKLFKIIKPKGFIYIGIENRTHFRYFFGGQDPHTGLKYVTIMPRRLASIYSILKTEEPYLNYIYSAKGLSRLLEQSGFTNVRVYNALPTYNDPVHLISLEKKKDEQIKKLIMSSRRWEARFLRQAFYSLGILKYIGYAYIAFAQK